MRPEDVPPTLLAFSRASRYLPALRLSKDKVSVFGLVDGVMVKFGCDFPQLSLRSQINYIVNATPFSVARFLREVEIAKEARLPLCSTPFMR